MARSTKDRLDHLEESFERVEHVIGHVDDLLSSISQRLEDLAGCFKESQLMIDTLSAKVQSMALKITRLQEAGVVLVVA